MKNNEPTQTNKQIKHNAFWLTVRLYAYKLANYSTILGATTMSQHIDNMSEYKAPKVGPVNPFHITHYDIPEYQGYCDDLKSQGISAEYFLEPVLQQVQDAKSYKAKNIVSQYQWNMVDLFKKAQKIKIIDKQFNILDMKRFKTDFLEKCVLPCILPDDDHIYDTFYYEVGDTMNVFHSLTNGGIVHLVREQTEQVFNEPVYKNHQVYKNGIIHDEDILRGALEKLRYLRFTNAEEIEQAVGTNGIDLSRKIAHRMAEWVK